MKLAALLFPFFCASSIAFASLYAYPNNKKPAVSLIEACEMAATMLKSQGDEGRYHIVGARLLGDESQSGDGAWTIYFYDTDGNQVWAHIPLRDQFCALHYYPHDYDKKGGDREVEFARAGTKVSVPGKERKKPK